MFYNLTELERIFNPYLKKTKNLPRGVDSPEGQAVPGWLQVDLVPYLGQAVDGLAKQLHIATRHYKLHILRSEIRSSYN